MGWAVAVPDVAPHAARLGVPATTIAREGLTATLAGAAAAIADPGLPFFIARDAGVADPGAGSDAGGIARLVVRGDAARLQRWLGGASLPVTVELGPPAVVAVHLGDGRIIR